MPAESPSDGAIKPASSDEVLAKSDPESKDGGLALLVAVGVTGAVLALPVWALLKLSFPVAFAATSLLVGLGLLSDYGRKHKMRLGMLIIRTIASPHPFRRFMRWATGLGGKPLWVVGSIVVAVTYAAVLALAYSDMGKKWVEANGQTKLVQGIVHPLWVVILLLAYPIVKEVWSRFSAYYSQNHAMAESQMLDLLTSNRHEYVHELVRIYESASAAGGASLANARLEVVREIADHVRTGFITISPKKHPNVKVRVFEVVKGKITRQLAIAPANEVARTPISIIADERSTAMRSVRSKKIKVISDIKKEVCKGNKSQYYTTEEFLAEAVGSLICYPIRRRKNEDVIAVVCIRNAKENAFDELNSPFYDRELGLYEADLVIGAIFDAGHETLAKNPA